MGWACSKNPRQQNPKTKRGTKFLWKQKDKELMRKIRHIVRGGGGTGVEEGNREGHDHKTSRRGREGRKEDNNVPEKKNSHTDGKDVSPTIGQGNLQLCAKVSFRALRKF
jgi:hypothetical protein